MAESKKLAEKANGNARAKRVTLQSLTKGYRDTSTDLKDRILMTQQLPLHDREAGYRGLVDDFAMHSVHANRIAEKSRGLSKMYAQSSRHFREAGLADQDNVSAKKSTIARKTSRLWTAEERPNKYNVDLVREMAWTANARNARLADPGDLAALRRERQSFERIARAKPRLRRLVANVQHKKIAVKDLEGDFGSFSGDEEQQRKSLIGSPPGRMIVHERPDPPGTPSGTSSGSPQALSPSTSSESLGNLA